MALTGKEGTTPTITVVTMENGQPASGLGQAQLAIDTHVRRLNEALKQPTSEPQPVVSTTPPTPANS